MYDSDYHGLADEDSPLLCKHGYVPAKFVAFEGRNAGRRFLRCQGHRAMMQGGSCGVVKWVDPEWPKSMQKTLDKLWEMTVELKESVFSSLLDSVEMKLWEPVDTTKHKRDLMGVEDKVSKVEKERDAALALKAKAEQELTQARNDLHQAKVLQFTTTSIDKCMRKNAEKQLKLCKEDAKRKEQTIRSLLSQEDAHRAKIRKIKEMCDN